jgi:hypothetical protein
MRDVGFKPSTPIARASRASSPGTKTITPPVECGHEPITRRCFLLERAFGPDLIGCREMAFAAIENPKAAAQKAGCEHRDAKQH